MERGRPLKVGTGDAGGGCRAREAQEVLRPYVGDKERKPYRWPAHTAAREEERFCFVLPTAIAAAASPEDDADGGHADKIKGNEMSIASRVTGITQVSCRPGVLGVLRAAIPPAVCPQLGVLHSSAYTQLSRFVFFFSIVQ